LQYVSFAGFSGDIAGAAQDIQAEAKSCCVGGGSTGDAGDVGTGWLDATGWVDETLTIKSHAETSETTKTAINNSKKRIVFFIVLPPCWVKIVPILHHPHKLIGVNYAESNKVQTALLLNLICLIKSQFVVA
jgi:hypothetical protein